MRKLKNPYAELPEHNCFGCSPRNVIGLNLEFHEEGDYIICHWQPVRDFEGFPNVLHGGIQSTLMDEIASWVVFAKMNTAGFTTQMNVKLLKPVLVDKGKITLKAKLTETKRNLAFIHTEIYNSDEVLCSEGTMVYFTYSPEKAREALKYPGGEKF